MYDELVKFFPASVHPNHITLMGGCFAILSNVAIYNDWRWSGFILFTLYHMFDNMDGKHARRTKQSSEIGAILDHFVDGTAGIWSGAVGLQFALNVDQDVITQGVWAFTFLFWCVHMVHALTGFFEIGGEYLSIDEAFLLLSLVRLIHALHIPAPPLLDSRYLHLLMVFGIYCSGFHWLLTHGVQKVRPEVLKAKWYIVAAYAFFVVVSQYVLVGVDGPMGPVYTLAMFAPPYMMVLWESKDKH